MHVIKAFKTIPRPHYRKIKKDDFRAKLRINGWGMRRGYCAKMINGREAMCHKAKETDEQYCYCVFQWRDRFLARIGRETRRKMAIEARKTIKLVK